MSPCLFTLCLPTLAPVPNLSLRFCSAALPGVSTLPNIFLCTYWLSPFVLCHILPHVVRSLCQSGLACTSYPAAPYLFFLLFSLPSLTVRQKL